ncbi:nicotinate-nucleotide--dimethylbenzimidazole phosphoribosyltransferase [Wenjunlia tyrosinilytica]|uniref:Nicotinate-nucleotide--dimethylbenzimidazole phosphoribosyltransferase n=1 Tax=Wenjunlia tyrosinilytica TaxID=1544741 RepID=A0A917ZDD4_9ACTN|nr:nicotinate-nucleotide--dimethylbenzimidazole phosphoribosyltransferase [Wenjunlia tyrosinilytica]GGO79764.1 nicotinate-nucleotide--dimethylbenzimidazole phosphoribosyltransferase [Wenjunlia tyrosinilytica]
MSALNLDDFADTVERPDAAVQRDAEERRHRLGPPAGSLGRLEELGDWLAAAQGQCPARRLDNVKVVLFAGDHGVARLGVSAREPGTTVSLVREVLEGEAAVSVLARAYDAQVRVVDMSVDCDPGELPAEVTRHRVRRGSGRIDIEDALTAQEAEQAFRAGMAVADEEADSGTDLVVLGDLSVGGTTVAGVLVAALCGTDASVVTGRGSGIDDLAWMRKCAAIRDALRRARPVLGDQMELLATTGGADFAAMAGFLAQCAVRRTPVVLDGVVSAACALVVQRIAFRAPDWWQASQSTGEPALAKALDRLALEPLVDHGVKLGEGTGALLALPVLRAAAALLAELPERAAAPEPGPEADEPAAHTVGNPEQEDSEPQPGAGTEPQTRTETGTRTEHETGTASETRTETGTRTEPETGTEPAADETRE